MKQYLFRYDRGKSFYVMAEDILTARVKATEIHPDAKFATITKWIIKN